MKIKLVVLAGVMLVVVMTSCSQDDGITYSCNKEIDRWVKSNLDEIQEMTTVEFLEFNDVATQRAVYSAFSIEQKQSVWLNKIENILQFDWTEKEREHIESLLLVIKNSDFFGVKDDVVKDQFYLAAYKWHEYAEEELGWSKEIIYAISGTPNEVYKKNNLLQVSIETQKEQPSTRNPYCYCIDWHNYYDDCINYGFTLHCVRDFNMCYPEEACGWFWGMECNGQCA